MKKIVLLIAALVAAFEMTAQWHPGAEIDINNVKTTLYGTGNFFRMRGGENSDQGYYVPSNDIKSTIFQNTMWIGGLDADESLHMAAVRFNQLG